jgi:hypothetical protein
MNPYYDDVEQRSPGQRRRFMPHRDFTNYDLDPDLVVSWNLRKARELRGWTQAQATEQLDRYGLRWSVASLSDAERAWTPDGRIREFTASDLVTFSLAFELPLAWWFLPPPPDERGDITVGLDRVEEPLDDAALVKLSLGSSPEIEKRLASLGHPRSLADEDKRRLLALIDAQEAQLVDWIEAVKDARAAVDPLPRRGNSKRAKK